MTSPYGNRGRRARALSILAAAGALGACEAERPGLATSEIIAEAEAQVRDQLELSPGDALFTDVFVPGYEDGELMVCGAVAGVRADGMAIEPRRFILRLEPARWVAWERAGSPQGAAGGFAATWSDICRHPDDKSKVPLVPV